ncbi:putative DDE superfamily endonuclease [Monocercomonoides exilis]|uniref:putative DDE superfamily endonuclease n=1 Tax=Monocercomonoides exilis TaxID=2049356 RepID=UPI0035594BB1|nr:putative DDE superfamily endonuclease [Monocercomonoides exilis]|eukprot:MONOS_6214.1-p1 / transcript=MONOS_6214.1 / gene=MONOS_6214 / organism=Monocercomonoides_exilis_PA203 / gene_product=unspecified product / transcript_product=unspecified product / location=Mono_scaffold00193:7064-8218(+) / protein_length=384 / sequence_SO=supercontig / SO=protein_coding / is_pseudo=false
MVEKSSLHHSSERINSKLKRASEELEKIIEEKTKEIPPADIHVPNSEQTDQFPFLQCETIMEKKKLGRPKKKIEINEEKKKRKQSVQLPNDMRELLKKDYKDGKTLEDLSKKYNISISTASVIAREEKPPKPRGGKVYEKITKEASNKMAEIILRNPTVTSKELADSVGGLCKSKPSVSTIGRHLKSDKMIDHRCPVFSEKRLRKYENARADEKTLNLRKEYVRKYIQHQMEGRTFVYIDETGFNTLELRTEGRSPVGKRCIQYREKAKIETVTAITAISELSGIEHVTFVEGSVNDQSFRVFLLSLMEKLQSHGRESFLLVMDNVGLHKTEAVINLITSKNYGILYTAPNSCELNPIEYVFGMWKARLKIPSLIKMVKKKLSI